MCSETLTQVYLVKSQAYYDLLAQNLGDLRILALRSHQKLVDAGLRSLGVNKPTRRLSQIHNPIHPAASPLDIAPRVKIHLPSLPQPSLAPRIGEPSPSSASMRRDPMRRSLPTLLPSQLPSAFFAALARPVLAFPLTGAALATTSPSLGPGRRKVASKVRGAVLTNHRARRRAPGLMEEVVGRLVQAAAPIDRQHTEPPRQMPVSITTFHPTRLMKPSM
jgi:hypothetical protein